MSTSRRRRMTVTCSVVLVTVGSSVGCVSFGDLPVDPYRPELIVSQLGDFAFDTYVKMAKTSMVKAHAQLTGRVVGVIAKHLKDESTDWQVQVVESDAIFAYGFPGGGIIVSTGLLDFAKDENGKPDVALLAVAITHEVAHVQQGHFLERLKRSSKLLSAAIETMKKPGWTPASGFDPNVTTGILAVMGIGAALPFDKEQEHEADRVAARLLGRRGPAASVTFWQRMAAHTDANAFTLTHPSIYDRIDRLEREMHRHRSTTLARQSETR